MNWCLEIIKYHYWTIEKDGKSYKCRLGDKGFIGPTAYGDTVEYAFKEAKRLLSMTVRTLEK